MSSKPAPSRADSISHEADLPSSPSREPRPVRNVLANWGAFLFGTVANFFLAPFIVHSLGNAAYGAWVLLGSVVGYLGLLDLGVRGAVTRFVARQHAARDHEEAARFASAGLFLFRMTSLVAVLLGVGLAVALPHLFEIPPELVREAQIAVVLSAMTIALALINGVYGGVVTAMQRFDLASSADMCIEMLRIGAVVVALRAGHGLVALAAIQLSCGAIRFVISFLLSRHLYPELRIRRASWTRSHLRQILGFSIASTALIGATMVIFHVDAIVIGAFLPVSMIAYYAIAGALAANGRQVVDGITYTVPPRVSAQEGRGDMDGARATALLGGKISTLVHLPIVATFMLRGETFIGLWMGSEYAEPSGRVLLILSIGYWFLAGRQIIATTLLGLNRHRVLIPAAWTEAITNLGLSVVLVRVYGINGVAWGTAIPAVLTSGIVYPLLFGKALRLPVGTIWREYWLRPSLAMVPFALASFAFERLLSPDSLVLFFAEVALALPMALGGMWWLALDREERASLARYFPFLSKLTQQAST